MLVNKDCFIYFTVTIFERNSKILFIYRNTMNTGGVGGIRRIKNAIGVARHVLINTKHSLLVGEQATDFGVQMGFKTESLSSRKSRHEAMKWKFQNNCQPNHWMVSKFSRFIMKVQFNLNNCSGLVDIKVIDSAGMPLI